MWEKMLENENMEDRNKKMVTAFWEAFSKGDGKTTGKYLADTATWEAMGTVGGDPMSVVRNKEEIMNLAIQMKTDMAPKGLTLTPIGWTCQDSRVAVEMEGTGVLAVDGKSYDNRYHFLIEIVDHKIASIKEYMDTLHAKRVFIDK